MSLTRPGKTTLWIDEMTKRRLMELKNEWEGRMSMDYIINDILDRLDELENDLVDDDIDCETDDLPDDDDDEE